MTVKIPTLPAKSLTRRVKVSEIDVVWPVAQRPDLRERTIRQIVENFNPLALGVPIVAERNGKGRYHCCDGMHRIEALRRLGLEDASIEVQVLPIHDASGAARVFVDVNGVHTRPGALALFRTRVAAKEPEAVAINGIVTACGYTIGFDSVPGHIAAVQQLQSVFRRYGGDVLRVTLETIRAAWGDDRDGSHGAIIGGWGEMIGRFPDLDPVRLAARVSKTYTPGALVGAARSLRSAFTGTLAQCVIRASLKPYNIKLAPEKQINYDD